MLRFAIASLGATLISLILNHLVFAQQLIPTPQATTPPVPSPPQTCSGQTLLQASDCSGDALEPEEEKLYQAINNYRAQHGLTAIPPSPSLNRVANRHVRDLADNVGRLTHAWSNCPYSASDPTTFSCMWEAPQRLNTPYPGIGYENAHFNTGAATAASALKSWQDSSGHNAVILNQDIWKDYPWQAIGIGIYKNYAVIWFGKEADPANNPNSR
ncbi:MAG: CAP domain-containing protein [Leptolyngbyaceae cyanobacterium CRU_2_3]|nr:CAP domain-containing protein [Leptolyngbyaceae cyanobacterium CRU_2_3]